MGYLIVGDQAGRPVQEYDTTWCRHCQAVVLVREAPGECAKCGGPLCATCLRQARTAVHEAFAERLDRALARAARAKAWGLADR